MAELNGVQKNDIYQVSVSALMCLYIHNTNVQQQILSNLVEKSDSKAQENCPYTTELFTRSDWNIQKHSKSENS